MAITEFGKAVRKARIDANNVTLASMASELQTTPSFLSALEMGRKRIPGEWVVKIESFFRRHGITITSLGELADVANKNVSLDGLSPAQQMLVAGFARVNLDEGEIANLRELLAVKKGSR
jgi:pseudouridine-5'-phosphate glycosidase